MSRNETYYFIVNGKAGVGRKKSIWKYVIKPELIRRGVFFHQYECSYPGHGTKIAAQIMTEHPGEVTLVVVGGDGTFNEVVNGIYDLDNCAVAPVPIGSGNDFIRSFHTKKEDFLNIDKLLKGTAKSVDLIKCNDKICANSVNIGFDCAVAKNVDIFKKWPLISSSFAYKA